jgi:hypothetical protein
MASVAFPTRHNYGLGLWLNHIEASVGDLTQRELADALTTWFGPPTAA